MKQEICYRQLTFFYRVLQMGKQRWVYSAMLEHIENNTTYYKHINNMRDKLNIKTFTNRKGLKRQLDGFFLENLNKKMEYQGLPINKIEKLSLHKQCMEGNLVMSTFRLKCEAVLNHF